MSEVETGAPAPRLPARKSVEGGSRWKLRNWRLRTKLIAVLMVPVVTVIALGVLRATSELERAQTFDDARTAVTSTLDVVALVHDLQYERTLVVDYVARGRTGDTGQMQGQIQKTNASLTRLNQAAANVSTERGGLLVGLRDRLLAIEAVRLAAIESDYPDVGVYRSYTTLLASVLGAGAEFTSSLVQSEISRLGAASLAIVEAKEFLSQQNAALTIAAQRNAFPPGFLDLTRAADASFAASINNFRANAENAEAQFFADTYTGAEVDARERIKLTAISRAERDLGLQIDRKDLADSARAASEALRKVEITLLEKLGNAASTAADDAMANAWRDAIIVLLAILAAMVVTFVVARSLLVPLRVLRRDALDVANRRLPETVQRILADPDPVEAAKNAVEPVPVFTREETGQLARSFDAVHDQAVRMATEQALLRDNINSIFVNLSRRSQTLVERQLALIDRLEQDEQDPDQLASLFELDHLATRMRRNSESLLVLSGSGLSRQLSRPVPAAEVVGAAVSEVEQYARIEVLSAPEISVQGRAVSDLVHLIAELLDNATSFSEPDKKVYVRMAVTRKKELAVQITDSGVGMSADEIEAANLRLADPPDLDVAVTRRMGLYVVARLAKRHDIKVRLRENEDIEGGLIARITVPAALVHGNPNASAPTMGSLSLPSMPSQTSMPSMPSMPSSVSSASSASSVASPATPSGGFPLPPAADETAARASGIAGAFTGSTPRVRTEGGFLSESQVDRPADEVAGFPPFQVGGGEPDDTGGWGPPASPEEIRARLNGHLVDTEGAHALFGAPLAGEPEPQPEPQRPESGAAPSNGIATAFMKPAERVLDAPTERLPIYEAVLSQWFEAGETGSQDKVGQDGAVQAEAEPAAEPAPEENGWTSPGDDGWRRARALLDSPPETTSTSAGLPKRVPKQHLVPGSAAPRETPAAATTAEQPIAPALPPRTADAIRGRMSSFQQGVRRGRHALIDAYAGDQNGSEESRRDEEQE
ncbi:MULTISPECIES: sensor histidine kinase [Actinokineospora]|uniref:histidine kinase n=1 Tax=Actinokineospora fastidiosa TaxID=1816 RepID=A0A918L7E9_9PSEU|nr:MULTISPECIES: nitrate- and nitrite sensing domain-containing protein [Actinokineospora]UVS76777.1 phosphate regulon sensor kinase PhoR [Actinokineospora sp. UTMC 2448]GGS15830.1 histidine kinase [Actinokineospora fastidiosa]